MMTIHLLFHYDEPKKEVVMWCGEKFAADVERTPEEIPWVWWMALGFVSRKPTCHACLTRNREFLAALQG